MMMGTQMTINATVTVAHESKITFRLKMEDRETKLFFSVTIPP